MAAKPAKIAICIVTFNSARTICRCLEAAIAQTGFAVLPSQGQAEPSTFPRTLFLVVVDNCSSDGSAELVEHTYGSRVHLLKNETNTGFAGGQNRAMTYALGLGADAVFLLNPDVRLESGALEKLAAAAEFDTRAGTFCPKLLRADARLNAVVPQTLDSSGMYMTTALRHFDRGSQELDDGRFNKDEYVFGATGAAVLIRSDCLKDTALPTKQGEDIALFDPLFHSYREDADFAWRAMKLGWKCRYVPAALGFHERRVLPERRAILPAELNAYSVRNRFLLQFNNVSFAANSNCIVPALWRNLLVLGAAATVERSSWSRIVEAFRAAPYCWKRRCTLPLPRVSASNQRSWFAASPYSEPALSCEPAKRELTSVLAVIINYNSGGRLESCMRALIQAQKDLQGRIDLHISVVDNASADHSGEQTKSTFQPSDCSFHLSGANLGFGGGLNYGVLHGEKSDAILILNPDVIVSAATVAQLLCELSKYPQLGAIAPVLKGVNGEIQHTYTARAFPTVGSTLAELFFLHRLWPSNPWTSQYQMESSFVAEYLERKEPVSGLPHENLELPLLVPQPAAACLLVRSDAFTQLGGFDSSFWPAWFEDVDFCKRLEKMGLLCAVTGKAEARHEGGYSLKSLARHRFLSIYYGNLLRYWKKHGTRLEYYGIRVFLPLALLLRSIITFYQAARHTERTEANWETPKSLLRMALGFRGRER